MGGIPYKDTVDDEGIGTTIFMNITMDLLYLFTAISQYSIH